MNEPTAGQAIQVSAPPAELERIPLVANQRSPGWLSDKIAGIVSIGDLVNWIISAQTTTISQLQTYITGVPG